MSRREQLETKKSLLENQKIIPLLDFMAFILRAYCLKVGFLKIWVDFHVVNFDRQVLNYFNGDAKR